MLFITWNAAAESRICWQDDRSQSIMYDGPKPPVYIMRKNREYATYDLDLVFIKRDPTEFSEAVGVIDSDTAQSDGLSICTLAADGYAEELFSYMPETPEGFREVLPEDVVAYADGYLYYYLYDSENNRQLCRDDMNGNTFIYEQASPGIRPVLSLEGQIAWSEEEGLLAQKPGEEPRLVLLPGEMQGIHRRDIEYYSPIVWIDERTLLIWALDEYDPRDVYPRVGYYFPGDSFMVRLDVETGEWSPWHTQNGRRIRYVDKMPKHGDLGINSLMDLHRSGRYLTYWYYSIGDFGFPMVLDLQTGELEEIHVNENPERYYEHESVARPVWQYD